VSKNVTWYLIGRHFMQIGWQLFATVTSAPRRQSIADTCVYARHSFIHSFTHSLSDVTLFTWASYASIDVGGRARCRYSPRAHLVGCSCVFFGHVFHVCLGRWPLPALHTQTHIEQPSHPYIRGTNKTWVFLVQSPQLSVSFGPAHCHEKSWLS